MVAKDGAAARCRPWDPVSLHWGCLCYKTYNSKSQVLSIYIFFF